MTHTQSAVGAVVHTYDADGPIYLDAQLRASSMSVSTAPTDQVTVKVTLAKGVHINTDQEEVIVEFLAGTLHIEVPKTEGGGLKLGPLQIGSYTSHRYQIDVQIPEASSIKAQAGLGSITTSGWLESVITRCGSGRISVDQAREVYAKCGSGQVAVHRAEQLEAVAGSGDITVNSIIEGHLTAGSGDIRITSAEGHLELKTGSGDMRLGQITDASAIAGSGDVEIGQLVGRLSVKTGSGDITVQRAVEGLIQATAAAGDINCGIPSGTAVLQDCSTVSGRLGSALSEADGPTEADEHRLELRARTVSGNISVHRA